MDFYVPRERISGKRIKTQNTVRIMYEQTSRETRRLCDIKERKELHLNRKGIFYLNTKVKDRGKSGADEFAGEEGRREMNKVTTNDLNFPYKIERKGSCLDRRHWD